MKGISLVALATSMLVGCSSSPSMQKVVVYDGSKHHAAHTHNAHYMEGVVDENGQLYLSGMQSRSLHPEGPDMSAPDVQHSLTDYVNLMSQRLVSSSHYVNADTPIGVASFVPLDNLRTTDLFGMQLAESFVYEMQQSGFSVIDYKTTGFIRITQEGDFVYSRNVKELSKRLPIEYLLVGTFSKSNQGILVNARIVGAQSKVVVASAQELIPNEVYQSKVPAPVKRDGVMIIESRKQASKTKMPMGERG
ncbi:FlgO family outer membrane protein [Agarivorans aestuarii]|uniref:FlgO family outer membrane protein n=1 Tax=Agarivorans aestuarii TaxID=1563703 RepID=A0ABU7G0D9_9ALTE|nr:FlgO family outer membrane protein [Agarivorans aestuarii]MEE1672867.1 FlgO family outer membrane protein [Agarivorans aestuarii]